MGEQSTTGSPRTASPQLFKGTKVGVPLVRTTGLQMLATIPRLHIR